jgi:NADP-dependent 3-hydroxy acid dehydrogenase YdfG
VINDKVAIITGASSGIGEATAKVLASKGTKVVLGARRADRLKQIVEEIEKDGGQAVYPLPSNPAPKASQPASEQRSAGHLTRT